MILTLHDCIDSMQIKLCPIGKIETTLLTGISQHLAEIFVCETYVLPNRPIPETAFDMQRKQYQATKILIDLKQQDVGRDTILLALIDRDLYASQLNFVFGQADLLNGIAIVALPRLRQSYYGSEANPPLFVKRCLKECVHEVGHVLGLGHCHHPSCVMYFSNSLSDTDNKSHDFCPRCKLRIGKF